MNRSNRGHASGTSSISSYPLVGVCFVPLVEAMNTPRTKKTKRFSPIRKSTKSPAGNYTIGIKNYAFAERIGFLIGYWPHVEEAMVEIVQDLLGGNPAMPSRQIFYGMIANADASMYLEPCLRMGHLTPPKTNFMTKSSMNTNH
jgi:hypothetical protein